MHSAAILTRRYMRPVDGGVEVCARAACTTQLGQSVTSVPQATSQTPTAEWTVLMPAYVSGFEWKKLEPSHTTWKVVVMMISRNASSVFCSVLKLPHVCLLMLLPGCMCNAEGSVNGGRCDDSAGSCQCKVNVEGPNCDRCKKGYYGLNAFNPLGCSSESSTIIISHLLISLSWSFQLCSLLTVTV